MAKGEHRTARLKRKPGRRANQQASVASAGTRRAGRPQHANDRHGLRTADAAGRPVHAGEGASS
jgi:hypothetical protein